MSACLAPDQPLSVGGRYTWTAGDVWTGPLFALSARRLVELAPAVFDHVDGCLYRAGGPVGAPVEPIRPDMGVVSDPTC